MKKWIRCLLILTALVQLPGGTNYFVCAEDFAVSAQQSVVQLERQTAPANGESVVLLRGIIRDRHQTPLPNIPIKVASSRGGQDQIITQPMTDQAGRFTSRIRSTIPGQATISIWAQNTELYAQPQLTFYTDSRTANVGAGGFGQFLQASLFGNSSRSQTEYFVLEDLSSPLIINDKVSVKIVAKDANGNIDPHYRGTIRFVVPTDPNAQPPSDYTFTEADQGVHNFYLAVSFGTVGKHKLVVKDISDIRIAGEMEIEVIPRPTNGGNGNINIEGGANLQTGNININVPSNGSTFSASRITLSGTAPGIKNLQLFDGPTLVSNNIPVNADGTFAYQTPQLADGLHQFQFFSNDGTGQEFKSDKINVTIDQTPPSVLKVDLIPSNEAEPGAEVTVMVGSSEDLSSVEGIFQGQPMTFERMDERTFRAFITAPNNGGAYPISVSAADLLGNTKNEPNAEVLYVKLPQVLVPEVQAAPEPTTPTQYQSLNQDQTPPSQTTDLAPTAITNLSAVPGDNKVTLFWSPATDDQGIKQYQIDFGPDETRANTNWTPDARTQWYIDGLAPCEKIQFTVTAIDTTDQLSPPSQVIESAAKCNKPNTTTPPKTGSSQLFSILLGMIFGGMCVLFARLRRLTQ